MIRSGQGVLAPLCLALLLPVVQAPAYAADWWSQFQGDKKHVVLNIALDEGQGTQALDAATRKHASIHQAKWIPAHKQAGGPLILTGTNHKTIWDVAGAAARERFTLAVWCKPKTLDGCYLVLKKYAFGFPNFGGDGKVSVYLRTTQEKDWSRVLSGVGEVGQWQHYVLVVAGREVQVYVNGVRKLAATLPAPVAHSAEPILLGTSAGWGKQNFQGELGLVRLYDAALSADEVAAHYASLRDGRGPHAHAAVAMQVPGIVEHRFLKDDQNYEKAGHALEFDGQSAYVDAGKAPRLNPKNALTVGAWIRPEHTMPKDMSEQGYIVSKGSGNHAGYMLMTYYRNGLAALVVTDQDAFTAQAFNVLRKGEWQHVGVSWNGRVIQLYVDGMPVGKPTVTKGVLKPYAGALHIGKAADRTGQYFKGGIDDVKVLDFACGDTLPEGVGRKVITPAANSDPSGIVTPPMPSMAGRRPARKPLVDFEDLTGWTVTTYNGISEANLYRSQAETLYGGHVGKLVFKAGQYEHPGLKKIIVTPPKPIPIREDFDGINLWLSAQYWGKPKGAQVSVEVKDAKGRSHSLAMRSREHPFAFWSGWYQWHRRLPEKIKAPAELVSLTVSDFDGGKEETIYLGSLDCYAVDRSPVSGQVPSWADCPFPTTPDTILPSLEPGKHFRNSVKRNGDSVALCYQSGDETLTYQYTPKTGALSDIEVICGDGQTFQPAADGGWVIEQQGSEYAPADSRVKRKLKSLKIEGNTVHTEWQCEVGGESFTTRLSLTMKQKSLIIDMSADTTQVKEFRCGMAKGAKDPLLTEVPYIVLRRSIHASKDPAILYTNGMFMSCFMDWYNSEASELFGETKTEADTAMLNGGSAYYAKTDGKRNPPRERMFLTVSRDFREVLPNIPNPPNRWLETTKSAVWVTRSWYETMPRPTFCDEEYAFYEKLHHYGIRNLFIRNHVNLYRMYSPLRRGEPMTCTTDIVEGIGGQAKVAELFGKTQNALGYRVGLYTNYTLVFPTALEMWDENLAALTPEGNWRYGSVNCTQLKNSRILEMQKRFNTELKRIFNPTVSYLDQYNCPPLWRHTDYDHRVPGAGTFGAALRVLGVSALAESEQFGGPVLSEGIMQWMLSGLLDGYAQPGNRDEDLLVDFQLRKLHLLSNDCGFHLSMVSSKDERDLDRVLASQIAFGHIGHLFGCYGYKPPAKISLALIRSWYMIQQLQQYYATIPIDTIRYHNGKKFLTVSEAIPAGAIKNNRVFLTYKNGLKVFVNRNPKETWAVTHGDVRYTLPPDGYVAGLTGEILEYSAQVDGRRVDFVHGPQYTFCNANGTAYDFGPVVCAYSYAIRFVDGALVVIPAPFAGKEQIVLDLTTLAPKLAQAGDLRVEGLSADGRSDVAVTWSRPEPHRLALSITDKVFSIRVTGK